MLRSSLSFLAPLAIVASVHAAETQIITIKTLPAQMRYDVDEISVQPGASVKIVFENPDDMPHNLVFFQPGCDVVAICNKQMEKPEEALRRNWLPADPGIWLHSKLLNPKEKEELTFKAPDKLGTYPFVCTAPGHAMTMQGRLKVVPPEPTAKGPTITGLKFQMYLGDWTKLPDFSKLQPHREGSIADNLIQLKLDDYKNQFGVVYTGKIKAPKEGTYTFLIASDDGSRLLVNDKRVAISDGIHPSSSVKEGKIKLPAGEHDIRLEYFQAAGEAEVFAAWAGPGFAMTPLSKWTPKNWKAATPAKKKKDETTGMPLIVGTEPVVYRNFIEGAGNRGIGVGYPGGINIAWSAESFNLALTWRGAFIDAARHWNARGGGHQPPLGYDVFKPAGDAGLPFSDSQSQTTWPALAKNQRAQGYEWKGYTLDAKRFPTFLYEWNGVQVSDRFDVEGHAVSGEGKLTRTLRLTGKIPGDAVFRVASGNIQPQGSQFIVESGTKMIVTADGAAISGNNLILPARSEIKVTYSWPAMMHGHHAHAH